MKMHRIAAVALPLLLAAYASQPANVHAGDLNRINAHSALKSDYTGTPVHWGGRVVQVESRGDSVCVEVESNRLATSGRPVSDVGYGRFLACSTGFDDPSELVAGREVSFTGRISGYEQRALDRRAYRFARIDVEATRLWPGKQAAGVNEGPVVWGTVPALNPAGAARQ